MSNNLSTPQNSANIAIISTVCNFELYRKTSRRFPSGIPRYVIDGTNGMHAFDSLVFMMKKLSGRGIEWLIMADEDVIFADADAIADIIEHMRKGGFVASGVRDGGVISHRQQNPHAMNTFFCVLHFSEIERQWRSSVVRKHQYINKNEFQEDWSSLPYPYESSSLYEPYYRFFFWLRRNGGKFLFLDSEMTFPEDVLTNTVFFQGTPILYHTWHARSYGRNEKHTKRIDNVIEKCLAADKDPVAAVVFRDATFTFRRNCLLLYRRIAMKISILRRIFRRDGTGEHQK